MKNYFAFLILSFLSSASLLHAGKDHKISHKEIAAESADKEAKQGQKLKPQKQEKVRIPLGIAFEKPSEQPEDPPETTKVKKWVSKKKAVTFEDIEERYKELAEQLKNFSLDNDNSSSLNIENEDVGKSTETNKEETTKFNPHTVNLEKICKEYDDILCKFKSVKTDEERDNLHKQMEGLSALINGHNFRARRPKELSKEKFQELKEVLIEAATNTYLQAQKEDSNAFQEKK